MRIALAAGVVVLAALLLLAAFPWGMLRGLVARRLSAAVGQPVTIAALDRLDGFSFHPTVALRGLRIAQPEWAGGGALATLDEARVRFAALPLLIGHFRAESIDLAGLRLVLVRDSHGRESWHAATTGSSGSGGGGMPAIAHLSVGDAILTYRDARRDRSATVRLVAGPAGLSMAGKGLIHGHPVTVALRGAPVDAAAAGKPWPFRASVTGDAVGGTLVGQADAPLDFAHFSADVTGHGDDLALLDALIEAGFPATQPVRIAGKVRHDGQDWAIPAVSGTIGRSRFTGHATVKREGDRHVVDGAIHASQFDFDDLASDAGLQRAAAKRAKLGKRLIPDTRIALDRLGHTDGRLAVRVDRLLWKKPTPMTALSLVIALDHQHLTLDPLTVTLSHGTLAGHATVDQREGGPKFSTRLRLSGGRLIDFFPGAGIDGSLTAFADLAGPGATVRAAIGASSGAVGLVGRDGSLPARTASLLGQDVGRVITTGADQQARLRCMIVHFDVSHGTARADPLLIDTSRAQTRGTGTIDLSDERLSLTVSGAPKRDSLLRLSGSIPIAGTIKAPDIELPKLAGSVGGILKMVGKAISGDQAPTASDADCDALAARALR